ncbi:MAG: NAD(P)H-dependent oxidoreductase [Actinomycetota bacterium]
MRILTIPATSHRGGFNQQLLACAAVHLADLVDGELDVELVDLNDYELPIYSQDREAESGVPDLARELFDKIGAADGVIISFAEHNGSYTAAWKNIYDWMSRIDQGVYQGKPVAMLAATPGPRAGAGVLGSAVMAAPFFGAEVVGQLGVGKFLSCFDTDAGVVTDEAIEAQLRQLLRSLVAAIVGAETGGRT